MRKIAIDRAAASKPIVEITERSELLSLAKRGGWLGAGRGAAGRAEAGLSTTGGGGGRSGPELRGGIISIVSLLLYRHYLKYSPYVLSSASDGILVPS